MNKEQEKLIKAVNAELEAFAEKAAKVEVSLRYAQLITAYSFIGKPAYHYDYRALHGGEMICLVFKNG